MKELPEHLVHEPLEDWRWVRKAIRHNLVLVVTWGSYESSLPLVALPDTNEVIRTPQVQLREDASPTEFLERGRDQRKWIGEFNCVSIEGPVINAGPQASVFLSHEEEAARGGRWGGRADELLLESLLDVVIHCLALRDGQGVHSTLGECDPRQQVYSAVPWPVRW